MDPALRRQPGPPGGLRDRRFIQRGGAPAGIPPAAYGPDNASSIAFRRGGRPAWELLNGVQFRGRSAARHEIDIAVVPESVARALRSSPAGGRPRVSIECKDAGTSGSVDEMRTFVARLYDLTLLHSHHSYLPVADPPRVIHPGAPPESVHRPVISYRQENHRALNVLARRTGFVRGTAALSDYHAVAPHEGITVGGASGPQLMNDVADWIRRRDY